MGFFGKYYIVIYMQTMLYNSRLMRIHDVAIILTHFCINIYTKYFRTLINQAPPSPSLALSWGVTLNLFMLFVICGQDGCICFSFYVFVFCNVMYMWVLQKEMNKCHLWLWKAKKKNTMYTSSKASAQTRKTLDYTVMSLAIYYEIRKPLELNIWTVMVWGFGL